MKTLVGQDLMVVECLLRVKPRHDLYAGWSALQHFVDVACRQSQLVVVGKLPEAAQGRHVRAVRIGIDDHDSRAQL